MFIASAICLFVSLSHVVASSKVKMVNKKNIEKTEVMNGAIVAAQVKYYYIRSDSYLFENQNIL